MYTKKHKNATTLTIKQTGFGKAERQTHTEEEQAELREARHEALAAQRDKVWMAQ